MQLIHKFISPKSYDRDKARREFLLNVLLVGSIFLCIFALISVVYSRYTHIAVEDAVTPQILLFFTFFLVSLYWLSRIGKVKLSAFLLISFFYISGLYTFFKWGTDVTQAWLIFALLIVMSGVLVGTRFAFFLTVSLFIGISVLSYFQLTGVYPVSNSWRNEPFTIADTIILNSTLLVIAVIAWLSNRETEKSLQRARRSEAALKKESSLLEIKVEERTKALKQAQLEKVTQLYRFAELGRLSSSLFHDLVTPLSLISLNLEELKHNHDKEKVVGMQSLLKRAIQGTKYLETYVYAVRQQLQNQESKKLFSLNAEIKKVLLLVQHRLRDMKIKIIFNTSGDIKTYGNHIKFSQLVTNLLLNAVDSYEDFSPENNKREIIITLHKQRKSVIFSVKDFGKGIQKEYFEHIFQPFFTTKSAEKGTGIGLSISRDIVEKSFKGKIDAVSTRTTGTIFTITFPQIPKETLKQKQYASLKRHN